MIDDHRSFHPRMRGKDSMTNSPFSDSIKSVFLERVSERPHRVLPRRLRRWLFREGQSSLFLLNSPELTDYIALVSNSLSAQPFLTYFRLEQRASHSPELHPTFSTKDERESAPKGPSCETAGCAIDSASVSLSASCQISPC